MATMSISYWLDLVTTLSHEQVFDLAIAAGDLTADAQSRGRTLRANGSGLDLLVREVYEDEIYEGSLPFTVHMSFMVHRSLKDQPSGSQIGERHILNIIEHILENVSGDAEMSYVMDTVLLRRIEGNIMLYTDFWTYADPPHLESIGFPYESFTLDEFDS